MILYLDTSLLVAALTHEAASDRMLDWLAARDPETLAISEWVATEFSSALALKLRARHLEPRHRADALALFATLRADTFTLLPIGPAQFRTAARFVDREALGLRAGDALHLAICADHGARLCTLDRRLAEAAPVLGVATEAVSLSPTR